MNFSNQFNRIIYIQVYARIQGRSDEMRSVVSVVMMRSRIVLPRGICDDDGEVIWCGAAAETASALSHPFPYILFERACIRIRTRQSCDYHCGVFFFTQFPIVRQH